jgi:hypothetical protein
MDGCETATRLIGWHARPQLGLTEICGATIAGRYGGAVGMLSSLRLRSANQAPRDG